MVCAMRGHVAPALRVARLRREDRELGFETPDGRRMARCLRCDAWIETIPPPAAKAEWEVLPPVRELDLPRRGEPLYDAIVLRLIAIDRAVHAVIFGFLAAALLLIDT